MNLIGLREAEAQKLWRVTGGKAVQFKNRTLEPAGFGTRSPARFLRGVLVE